MIKQLNITLSLASSILILTVPWLLSCIRTIYNDNNENTVMESKRFLYRFTLISIHIYR